MSEIIHGESSTEKCCGRSTVTLHLRGAALDATRGRCTRAKTHRGSRKRPRNGVIEPPTAFVRAGGEGGCSGGATRLQRSIGGRRHGLDVSGLENDVT